eukprot:scaffold1679_cov36-Prasinocladus_malaysianus.AAC.2
MCFNFAETSCALTGVFGQVGNGARHRGALGNEHRPAGREKDRHGEGVQHRQQGLCTRQDAEAVHVVQARPQCPSSRALSFDCQSIV